MPVASAIRNTFPFEDNRDRYKHISFDFALGHTPSALRTKDTKSKLKVNQTLPNRSIDSANSNKNAKDNKKARFRS